MGTIEYHKLVRDRIPENIRAAGKNCEIRILEPEEYRKKLREKLNEEVAEYQDSMDPAELADILEVLLALGKTHGLDPDGLEQMRREKAGRAGGFRDRIELISVQDDQVGD